MKIRMVRTGGVAGLRMITEIDTATLQPAESSRVEELVTNADFFALPRELPSSGVGRDRYQYQLEVTAETGETHTVTLRDDSVPQEVRPLLERLLSAASYGR